MRVTDVLKPNLNWTPMVRTLANRELEGLIAAARAVKLRAILQRSHIVHCSDASAVLGPSRGPCAAITGQPVGR